MARKPVAAKKSARRSNPIQAAKAGARPKKRTTRGVGRVAASLPPTTKAARQSAERAFVKGLIARGEVAEAGVPLGDGQTHEFVDQEPRGTPRVARRRFSLR
jgi:hypothetical protein